MVCFLAVFCLCGLHGCGWWLFGGGGILDGEVMS